MTLIDSVQNGFRPSFPSHVDTTLSSLIKECWLHDPESRPIATAVLQILNKYFETLQKDSQSCPLPNGITVGDNQIILCIEPDTYLDDNDVNSNTATPTDSCSQSSSEINQSQLSTTMFQNSMASDVSCRAQTSLQQSGTSVITQLEMLKLTLHQPL